MNKPRTILAALFVLATLSVAQAEEKKAASPPTTITAEDLQLEPNISTIAIWSAVEGDKAKFREHLQKPVPFSGGLDKFWWATEGKDGFKFEMDGRALYENDYGLNLDFTKKDLGSIKLKADTYRRYYDSTGVYYPYAPAIYELNPSELYTDRGDFVIEATLALPNMPKFTVGYERMSKEGDQNMAWGGWLRQAPPGNDWILWTTPLSRELDYVSDRVYFAAEHTVAGFYIRLRQEWEQFKGSEEHIEPGFYTSGVHVFNRFYENTLDHTTWTTSLDVTKDLIEKVLILDLGYQYQQTINDNNFDSDARTPAGAVHDAEHAINFNNNSHDGWFGRHLARANLTWHATDDLTFTAGAKYKKGDTESDSQRNEEGSGGSGSDGNPATSEEIWWFDTQNREETWTESVKASLSCIPKTRLTLGADFEQSNVDYDWNAAIWTAGIPGESVTGQGNWLWDANTKYKRDNYWINIRSRPWHFLTGNLKYKYKIVKADVGENADIATLKPGDPEYEATATANKYYPGRMEGWRRPTHEAKLDFAIKPVDRVTLRPVGEYQISRYDTHDQIDETVETSTYTRMGYGISADFELCQNAMLTLNYMRQDITTETQADSRTASLRRDPFTGAFSAGYYGGLIEEFDGSYDTLSGVFTYTWNKLALRANAGMTNGKGSWDTHYYWAGCGADYKFSKNVSANAGYTHSRYDEDTNGNINNYYAHMVYLGVKARF
ncbi:MAG: porin [Verrucomicrobia bacterium]|nr:porin [Verrucomicrobiota bacterium]